MADDTADTTEAPSAPRRGCGCAALAGGVALVLLGIPMLVLPGPGIAAILAGLALVAKGLGLRPRARVR